MIPFVPGRPLVLAALVPVALTLAAIPAPELVSAAYLADGVVVLMAVLDLLFVRRGEVSVRRTLPLHGSIHRAVAVELEVQSVARRPLALELTEELFDECTTEGLPARLTVEPGLVRRVSYRLRPTARGPKRLGAHFIRYPSPMRFWFRQIRVEAEHELKVYPDVQAVRHYEMLARQNRDHVASRLVRVRGGDTEFERLRDYSPDDELRRVDWKATARRRKLTSREYQAERNQNVVFLLDSGRLMTSVWDELTALDWALNATLMLSHVAIRRGDLVGLVAFDEKVRRFIAPRGGVSASNQIIQSTYDLFPVMAESDYDSAFRALSTRIRRRSLVVLITHALDEPTAARIQRLTRELIPRHLPLCVLLKDREVLALAHRRPSDEVEYAVQGAAAEVLLWRNRLTTEMERAGVMVLDVLPKELTGALVAKYLEVKAGGLI